MKGSTSSENCATNDHNTVMPEYPPEPDKVDAFLLNAMLSLSVQDRNEITEEIHGVRCLARDETPELLEQSLSKMSTALEHIPPVEKKAYSKSKELFPLTTYSIDRDFRLRMLRCELFDVLKASTRLVKYMDFVMEIFGQDRVELLERPIHLKDLEEEEETYNFLRSGLLQLLSYRDRSGRRIGVAFLTNEMLSYSVKPRLRVFTYIWLTASNDIESQKKGMVGIALPAGGDVSFSPTMPSKEDIMLQQKFYSACPTRICALHFCFPDSFFYTACWKLVALTVGEKNKRRLKFNMGTVIELKYDLMSYGILPDLLPSTETGNIKLKNHLQWIQARKLIDEKKYNQDSIVECPALYDVVFKKAGKSWRLHPGDVYFRGLIESKHKEHLMSNQTEKKELIWLIVEEIESRKGRFVAWDERGWWVEVRERSEIRKKVAIALRNFNSRHKLTQKRQSCENSATTFVTKKRKQCHCGLCLSG